MTDIRTRLADALRQHSLTQSQYEYADFVADRLLSLPGIAIVELPEPMRFRGAPGVEAEWIAENVRLFRDGHMELGRQSIEPATARTLAAALLAAADEAEREQLRRGRAAVWARRDAQ